MIAQRLLRFGALAAENRIDYCAMFGKHRGQPIGQAQAGVPDAIHMYLRLLNDPPDRRVSGDLRQTFMHRFIENMELFEVISANGLLLLKDVMVKPLRADCVDPRGRLDNQRAFQMFANETSFVDLRHRNGSDESANLRNDLNQPFFGQFDQGFADRRSAETETLGNLGLRNLGISGQYPPDDFSLDHRVGLVGPTLMFVCWFDRHNYYTHPRQSGDRHVGPFLKAYIYYHISGSTGHFAASHYGATPWLSENRLTGSPEPIPIAA